ncbi:mannosyltransferase family protein [Nonomuraea sp. NPDC050556]|uniref:mannosyltransferase family protein n=1 Tax=Nonomuraea sp. NPDC050556 TaxID=3364369 RepID=UPI00379F088D
MTRSTVLLWTSSRLGLLMVGLFGVAWLAPGQSFLDRAKQWDAGLFVTIAEHGYDGDPAKPVDPGLPAFFPGMPMVLRVVHLAVPDWSLAGLIISLVAGGVAMVALSRLADFEGVSGWAAVLAVICFPTAVFLAAGYSEPLFLAFAIPAWLAARKGQWHYAVLLAAGASCVRITGLFLGVALIAEFFLGKGQTVRLSRMPLLVVPFLPLAAYSAFHYSRSGDWLAWKHAQEAGWGREMVWPWDAWSTTWGSTMGTDDFAVAFRMEIVGAVVAVGVLLWLLFLRRWSEFVYCGLQAGALMTSAYYLSIPRSLLLWFPLWVLLGRLSRTGIGVYALVFGPLMVVNTLRFLTGAWAG